MSEQTIERPRDDAGRFTGAAEHRAVEVSSAQAEAVKADKRPADAFQPMKTATPPPPKQETFSDSVEGLRAAAAELAQHRQASAPPVPRAYGRTADGKFTGERAGITETVDLKRASHDLADLRRAEDDAAEALHNMSLRERLDAFRQDANAADREAAPPVPEPQAEVAPEAPQQQTKLQQALADPEIRAALEQQAMAHEGARQQYLQSVQQLGNATMASVLSHFPELQQGNAQQVLEQMRVQNPSRFAEIAGHLSRVQQISNHWQQLQAQQQQQTLAQWQSQGERHDQEYTDYANSRPAAEVKAVKENVLEVMKSYGIDEREFGRMYNMGHPWARSGIVQRIFHDLTVLALARQAAGHKAPAAVAPVLRPGEVATGRVDTSALAAAFRAFEADPNNPRLAAKALVQRRKAAAGLR